jgi:hypothetical protein
LTGFPFGGGFGDEGEDDDEAADLYSDDDGVIVLNSRTFAGMQRDVNVVWLVQLYHVRDQKAVSFAPTYRKLAQSLKGIAKLGALNCAVEPKICKKLKAKSDSAFYLFPFGDKSCAFFPSCFFRANISN